VAICGARSAVIHPKPGSRGRVEFAQCGDARAGDHAAIAHQHQLVDAEGAQPRSKPPGPQDVLYRLPKAEVHGKGERGQQLGQRNTRVPSVAIHRVSIGASARAAAMSVG
jgi:hypothetical protein